MHPKTEKVKTSSSPQLFLDKLLTFSLLSRHWMPWILFTVFVSDIFSVLFCGSADFSFLTDVLMRWCVAMVRDMILISVSLSQLTPGCADCPWCLMLSPRCHLSGVTLQQSLLSPVPQHCTVSLLLSSVYTLLTLSSTLPEAKTLSIYFVLWLLKW